VIDRAPTARRARGAKRTFRWRARTPVPRMVNDARSELSSRQPTVTGGSDVRRPPVNSVQARGPVHFAKLILTARTFVTNDTPTGMRSAAENERDPSAALTPALSPATRRLV